MRRRGVASIVAVLGALALPAPASAIDHVSLQLYPSAVPGKPGWRLTGTAPGPEFFGGSEILGVTLRRSFRAGTAEEIHGLRQTLETRTFSFDGERGSWRSQGLLGDVLTVNMRVVRNGAERAVPGYRACRGDFVEVPVLLRGTFVLRTKTRFFGSIRKVQLRGLVTYNRGGPVDCSASAPATCPSLTQLFAWNVGEDDNVSVFTEDSKSSLILGFREPVGRTGPVWYHWMSVSGFDPLTGELPRLEVRLPPASPITGGGTFTALESSESTVAGCRRTDVRGTFAGTFRTRFAGWGARTLAVSNGVAEYHSFR
jgi:hypothetical protein